ncbi:hypothetical protein [Amycolatopsis aidingensis]|uniref:hypothetical protein n=1 Tax=Amycolatopsis aidingensis TaxID=2842453 RepID=UPI001C0E6A9E|nr:hypothetical protein [Amycolatopsis aidingensis]
MKIGVLVAARTDHEANAGPTRTPITPATGLITAGRQAALTNQVSASKTEIEDRRAEPTSPPLTRVNSHSLSTADKEGRGRFVNTSGPALRGRVSCR